MPLHPFTKLSGEETSSTRNLRVALGHLYSNSSGPFLSTFGLFRPLFGAIFGIFRPLPRFTKGNGDLFDEELEGGSGPLVFRLFKPLFWYIFGLFTPLPRFTN